MNTYSVEFFCKCPGNGIRISYRLRIDTKEMILVEKILEEVAKASGFHEDLADRFIEIFGGTQTITANHHGVLIETTRTR